MEVRKDEPQLLHDALALLKSGGGSRAGVAAAWKEESRPRIGFEAEVWLLDGAGNRLQNPALKRPPPPKSGKPARSLPLRPAVERHEVEPVSMGTAWNEMAVEESTLAGHLDRMHLDYADTPDLFQLPQGTLGFVQGSIATLRAQDKEGKVLLPLNIDLPLDGLGATSCYEVTVFVTSPNQKEKQDYVFRTPIVGVMQRWHRLLLNGETANMARGDKFPTHLHTARFYWTTQGQAVVYNGDLCCICGSKHSEGNRGLPPPDKEPPPRILGLAIEGFDCYTMPDPEPVVL